MDILTRRPPTRRIGYLFRPGFALRHTRYTRATVLWEITALLATLLVCAQPVHAQLFDSHEALETSWKIADHDCTLRLLEHARTFEQAHSGQVSECVRFSAGTGTYVHLVHPLPASRVIDELTISVWVKASHPGLQISARVILPRSSDPHTGGPLSTLIRGPAYQQAEKWQKLTIELPEKLLTRQLPLLRDQFGSDISPREAYIDLLVLNAYGGAGQTQVWLDDLEATGQVLAETANAGPRKHVS